MPVVGVLVRRSMSQRCYKGDGGTEMGSYMMGIGFAGVTIVTAHKQRSKCKSAIEDES